MKTVTAETNQTKISVYAARDTKASLLSHDETFFILTLMIVLPTMPPCFNQMFVFGQLGVEGVPVCVELCARALQLGDTQADGVTRSLVCKTIAFLLPHDLEICRACALLVFCQERTLEAYRTVCLLYMHPDQEPHPQNSPVRTSVRFHIVQVGGGGEGTMLSDLMV